MKIDGDWGSYKLAFASTNNPMQNVLRKIKK